LSFLARGQQVPEDIDEATLDRVLGSLSGKNQSSPATGAASAHTSRRIALAA
jgi:flagellar biosynthesis GTPase FlhF